MTTPIEIELKLTIDEVNGIMAALGELPSKTGAFSLMMKIKEQADPQVPPQDPPSDQGGV